MAVKWQSSGNQVAIKWQSSGNQVAAGDRAGAATMILTGLAIPTMFTRCGGTAVVLGTCTVLTVLAVLALLTVLTILTYWPYLLGASARAWQPSFRGDVRAGAERERHRWQ